MDGVEAAAFHALEQQQMSARVDDGDGDRELRFPGARYRRVHGRVEDVRVLGEADGVRDVERLAYGALRSRLPAV